MRLKGLAKRRMTRAFRHIRRGNRSLNQRFSTRVNRALRRYKKIYGRGRR